MYFTLVPRALVHVFCAAFSHDLTIELRTRNMVTLLYLLLVTVSACGTNGLRTVATRSVDSLPSFIV